MDKKERTIYEVELSEIASWDDENEIPLDSNPIVSIDGVDPSLVSAHLDKCYRYYRQQKKDLDDWNEDAIVDLIEITIEVTDEEWAKLLKLDSLTYDDYGTYVIPKKVRRILASAFKHEGYTDESCDDALAELLRMETENYNMRVICEKAGVSYSTFRGFKNNHQPFSFEKMLRLLKCMNDIGLECWDEDLEETYSYYKK